MFVSFVSFVSFVPIAPSFPIPQPQLEHEPLRRLPLHSQPPGVDPAQVVEGAERHPIPRRMAAAP